MIMCRAVTDDTSYVKINLADGLNTFVLVLKYVVFIVVLFFTD